MYGMFGNECVATTWEGKRLLLDRMNEFGGFLTPEEATDWARKEILDYSQWDKYEKIEIYTLENNKPKMFTTVYSEELRPDLDFSDKRKQ